MKKLHRLFLGAFIGPFSITFMVVLFLLVMQFLWKYMDDMIGKGLELNIVFQLLFYASANLVPIALPIAVLLASIMTLGNFGENYELVAIKSAGISLIKSLRPLIYTAIFIGFSAFLFTNFVWPVANLKMKTLLYDITHKKPALEIKEKIYYKEIEGYVIRVMKKGKDGQSLYGVTIYDHTANRGNVKIIKADSGRMRFSKDEKNLLITMYNGYSWDELESTNDQKNNYPLFRNKFEEQTVLFDMSSFDLKKSEEDLFKDSYEMLNLKQLEAAIDTTILETKDFMQRYTGLCNEPIHLFSDSILYLQDNSLHKSITELPINIQKNIYSQTKSLVRNAKQLQEVSAQNKESNDTRISRYKIEWHRKFSVAYVSFILFFVGAPLGAIIRKGGMGMPVIVSIIIFLFYYVISIVGEKLVKQGEWEAHRGMWLASFILTPIAIFLSYKSNGDSKLFDFSISKIFFRIKLFRKKS